MSYRDILEIAQQLNIPVSGNEGYMYLIQQIKDKIRVTVKSPCKVLVYKEGSTVIALDMDTAEIISMSTDATAVIQAALNALTSGRTWKEKVVIKGNYENLGQILIPSYTILELQGKIKAKAGLNTDFVTNMHSSGDVAIEICGGEIDPNSANQTADMNAIHMKNVTDVSVHDLKVYSGCRVSGTMGEGIRLYNCAHGRIYGVYGEASPNGYDLIKIWDGHHISIFGNIIEGHGWGYGFSRTIQACGGAWHVSIVGNVVHIGEGGIKVHNATQVSIIGNVLYKPTRGLWFLEGADYLVVKDNIVWEATQHGIDFMAPPTARYCIFEGNIINIGSNGDYGLYTTGEGASYNIFRNNYFIGNGTSTAIYIISGCNYNIFEHNKFINWGSPLVSDAGTGNLFRWNDGYPTEKEGIATFSGDGTTTTFNIPHGLVSTPVNYGVIPLTPDADAKRTITVDPTNIKVTYDSAPPSGTDNIKLSWWARTWAA